MSYTMKTDLTTFKAFCYSTLNTKFMMARAFKCTKHSLCMAYTYKTDTEECKLFSKIWPTSENVPAVTLEGSQTLYVANN